MCLTLRNILYKYIWASSPCRVHLTWTTPLRSTPHLFSHSTSIRHYSIEKYLPPFSPQTPPLVISFIGIPPPLELPILAMQFNWPKQLKNNVFIIQIQRPYQCIYALFSLQPLTLLYWEPPLIFVLISHSKHIDPPPIFLLSSIIIHWITLLLIACSICMHYTGHCVLIPFISRINRSLHISCFKFHHNNYLIPKIACLCHISRQYFNINYIINVHQIMHACLLIFVCQRKYLEVFVVNLKQFFILEIPSK